METCRQHPTKFDELNSKAVNFTSAAYAPCVGRGPLLHISFPWDLREINFDSAWCLHKCQHKEKRLWHPKLQSFMWKRWVLISERDEALPTLRGGAGARTSWWTAVMMITTPERSFWIMRWDCSPRPLERDTRIKEKDRDRWILAEWFYNSSMIVGHDFPHILHELFQPWKHLSSEHWSDVLPSCRGFYSHTALFVVLATLLRKRPA